MQFMCESERGLRLPFPFLKAPEFHEGLILGVVFHAINSARAERRIQSFREDSPSAVCHAAQLVI